MHHHNSSHMVAELGPDAPVPQMAEQLLEVPKIISQCRILQQTLDILVPQVVEEILEVIKVILQERISERIVEQIVDASSSESLAATLASEVASKNSCAHVTADHEVSAKTSAEELKTLAEATQVLQSETCGADGQMYSLFQENSSVACQTSTDLKGFDMRTAVKQLAEQEHFATLAQLGSRTSAIMKFGADADNDPSVKMKDLITDFSRTQADASPETSQKSHCAEEASKATETKEDLGAQVAKHSSELLSVVYKNAIDSRRAAWRVITSIEQKEKSKGEEQLASYAREYIAKVEGELQKIRDGILALMDKKLVPSASTDETKVSYYKMKSDYHRYLAEQDTEAPNVSSRDRISQHTMEQTLNVPVPEMVTQSVEVLKTFSQNRAQQHFGGQIVDPCAVSLTEKTVAMPDTRTHDKTQHVVNTHAHHVVNTVEVEKPKIIELTVQRKKPIIQEKINQVTKHIKIPQVQFLNKVDDMLVDVQQQIRPMAQTVQKTTEIPQLQLPDQVVDVPVVVQRQVPNIETVQKTVEVPQTQSIVKELRSKFEVGHTNKVHAQNQPDKNRAIRNAQKTVEVPRVQYIDKVADIPVDMQRQVSTTQAAQDIEEVEDVSALTQSEVPNIPDDDEDWLEQENKRRRLPTPAEAVSESHADESDFDRFDDLVLPSPERKTLFMSIGSGDEAEDEPEKQQAMTRCLDRHADWAQELREERRKFTDDVASDMSDVKNELAHVRELLGVLVRRERRAETKTEIAARRLDRMEREQHEADDAEHEASLEEALSNQSKAVKVVVDKWFVDKGYGFGKAPTGEIVFIHASAVQGAEVLTIGTDAWVQVVNDDARAQGGYRAKKAWGRNAWKAERDRENANKVAQQVKRAAALTAELAAQSEKKTAAVCDQPPILDELARHIEAPNMGAGGSHPQAHNDARPMGHLQMSLRRRRPNHEQCSS